MNSTSKILDQLNAVEATRWAEVQTSIDTLPKGIGGLTGLCLGVSAEFARKMGSGNTRLQPIHKLYPDAEIVSKLMLKHFWDHVPQHVLHTQMIRDKYPALIHRIETETMQAIAIKKGLLSQARLPQDPEQFFCFSSRETIQELYDNLLELSKRSLQANQTIFAVISRSDQPVLEWHVIAIHPFTRSLADSGIELQWQAAEASLEDFTAAITRYLCAHYGIREKNLTHQVHLLQVQAVPEQSYSFAQLCLDRIQTIYSIGKHNLGMAAAFFADSLPGISSLVRRQVGEKISSDATKVMEKEAKNYESLISIAEKEGRFDDVVYLVKVRIASNLPLTNLTIGLFIPKTEEEADAYAVMLQKIAAIGPKAYPILNHLISGYLNHLMNGMVAIVTYKRQLSKPFWQHVRSIMKIDAMSESSEDLLHLRFKGFPFGGKYKLDDPRSDEQFRLQMLNIILEEYPNYVGDHKAFYQYSALYKAASVGDLPVVKRLLQACANPQSPIYPLEDTPASVARKNGHQEIAAFLEAYDSSPVRSAAQPRRHGKIEIPDSLSKLEEMKEGVV